MGQIKNIKLHIVTDIKTTNTESSIPILPEPPTSSSPWFHCCLLFWCQLPWQWLEESRAQTPQCQRTPTPPNISPRQRKLPTWLSSLCHAKKKTTRVSTCMLRLRLGSLSLLHWSLKQTATRCRG